MTSKLRDTPAEALAPLVRPLNARSLALSALLGTHPPVLPGRSLVALSELFGIAGGTMRTALSRMVAAGELTTDDGRYGLAGRMLDRQRAQDLGRRAPSTPWDGDWITAIALDDRRPLDERRRARQLLTERRFGELRPDIWMRPANLPVPTLDAGWFVIVGRRHEPFDRELARRLWDLPAIAEHATAVHAALQPAIACLESGDPAAIPTAFAAAAAVVRFLGAEPVLPESLLPDAWPVPRLRTAYDAAESQLQAAFRAFFRSV